jgi:hypothetical protein
MALSIDDYLNFNIWDAHKPGYFETYIDNLENKTYKKYIYWCHDEFEYWHIGDDGKWDKMVEIFKRKNIKPYVITGAAKYITDIPNRNDINLIFWPAYYYMKTYCDVLLAKPDFRVRKNKVISEPEKLNYKYHFICMNKRVRNFRCEIIDLLARENLLDSNAVSWFYDDVHPMYHEFLYWKPQILHLDKDFYTTSDQGCVPEQYYESFAQLIPEADVDRVIFPTEKTITALLLGKPFLSVAPRGFHTTLQEMGFQLYDEIFDYRFDLENQRYKRWIMLIDNFKRLQETPLQDLNKLAEKIKPKLQYNMNRAYQLALNYDLNTPEIVKEAYQNFLDTGVWMDNFAIPLLHTIKKFINTNEYTHMKV